MTPKILYLTIVFTLLASISAKSQTSEHKFSKALYPDSAFIVTIHNLHLGNVRVQIRQVKPNKLGETFRKETNDFYDFYCRVWLDIYLKGKKKSSNYFQCDPVGGSFGFYVPHIQPSRKYLAIIAIKDYDGELFLINRSGQILRYGGGAYWLTKDKRFLFSDKYSDLESLGIIDLTNGRAIYRGSYIDSYDARNWYENNGEYFFARQENPDSIFVFNFTRKHFEARILDSIYFAKSVPIKWDFVPPDSIDCGCVHK